MIIDILVNKIKEKSCPIVAGLDPRLSYIPDNLKKISFEKYGKTLKGAADCIYEFNKKIIDETYDIIPAVKPQIAFYEIYGAEGIDCYINTVKYAKSKGLTVIGDIKRSDIASTAEAYSDAHIGKADIDGEKFEVFSEDFITVNPYLGKDSITPFLQNCKLYDKGLFILVKTSNAGGSLFQDLYVTESKVSDDNKHTAPLMLYEKIGDFVSAIGNDFIGENGYSSIGAVIGATHKSEIKTLRKRMKTTFFLIPGYGAQGGTAEDIKEAFDENGAGAIVNSSRGIMAAWQLDKYSSRYSPEEFDLAAKAAVYDMNSDLKNFINI